MEFGICDLCLYVFNWTSQKSVGGLELNTNVELEYTGSHVELYLEGNTFLLIFLHN
uniref:Uncharacterized protein n=1 Tax=Anguilla anguilla TaxID=7936 RepID=A0A0E9PHF9_ANGAN